MYQWLDPVPKGRNEKELWFRRRAEYTRDYDAVCDADEVSFFAVAATVYVTVNLDPSNV
jgi:hypothetical protein